MISMSKKAFTIVLVLFCGIIFYGLRTVLIQRPHPAKLTLPARVQGNPQAGLRIVEFIDFQCPSCATGVKILRKYFEKYPNQIRLEIKYFPLAMHAHGLESAVYGECAAQQGKFWPYFDLLIDHQPEWGGLIDANPALRLMAEEAGVKLNKFDACLQGADAGKVVARDMTEGMVMGVRATPTYFINKEMVVGTTSLTDKLRQYFKEDSQTAVATPPKANETVK